MSWEVEHTDEFERWWDTLTAEQQDAIVAAVEVLKERGPALGRPLVDTVAGSRHANLKELRPPAGHIRVLFAFDPRRIAILLSGGDKRHEWGDWYKRMIPLADDLYDSHLATIGRRGN